MVSFELLQATSHDLCYEAGECWRAQALCLLKMDRSTPLSGSVQPPPAVAILGGSAPAPWDSVVRMGTPGADSPGSVAAHQLPPVADHAADRVAESPVTAPGCMGAPGARRVSASAQLRQLAP